MEDRPIFRLYVSDLHELAEEMIEDEQIDNGLIEEEVEEVISIFYYHFREWDNWIKELILGVRDERLHNSKDDCGAD
ncbi:hypothetical protein ISS30_10045 [bacterium]|nr:hypothetical protein [bacterium]